MWWVQFNLKNALPNYEYVKILSTTGYYKETVIKTDIILMTQFDIQDPQTNPLNELKAWMKN